MKRSIVSFVFGAALMFVLFGGSKSGPPLQPVTVQAQSSSPRSDLVTAFRLDVANFNSAMDSFVAHRAEYVARNINFVIGDMVGSNNSTSFVADDIDQMVVDMNTIVTDVRSGGTISVGVWNNVIKIK